MDKLNKTIKQLSQEKYNYVLDEISGGKKNKPYLVLVNAREKNLDDDQMREILGVNASTYYTLKSRLNQKLAAFLAKEIDNPISELLEEVKRVPALMYGTNKNVTIKVLRELEKRLKDYDLSNELIVVYKALARLNRFNDDLEYYEKQYKMHVAFSLAVAKAEDLFYEFMKRTGLYMMSYAPSDLELIRAARRELSNITDLYESHRLYVFYNIVRVYYLCLAPHKRQELKEKESELQQVLDKIEKIFEKYELNVMYQNFKMILDLLRFEYYTRVEDAAKADMYYRKVNPFIHELAGKHIMSFYVVQFLNSKIRKFLKEGNENVLKDNYQEIISSFDVDSEEVYHYVCFKRYLAIVKFYEGEYAQAGKIMNDLRNEVSLKPYPYMDMECKLFQALQYCLCDKHDLCLNIINNVRRHLADEDLVFKEKANLFIKLLKAAMKTSEFRQKLKRMNLIWNAFIESGDQTDDLLWYVKLDERIFRTMANPIRSQWHSDNRRTKVC